MSIDALPELVSDWKSGEVSWRDVYARLLDLLATHEVDAINARLPGDVRDLFVASLREGFDNDIAAHDLVWIDTARGEHPQKAAIVASARRWLAANPRRS